MGRVGRRRNLSIGYSAPVDPVSRAFVVNPAEAGQVRAVFERCLEAGRFHLLQPELLGIRPHRWGAHDLIPVPKESWSMSDLYGLTEEQMARLEPFFPQEPRQTAR